REQLLWAGPPAERPEALAAATGENKDVERGFGHRNGDLGLRESAALGKRHLPCAASNPLSNLSARQRAAILLSCHVLHPPICSTAACSPLRRLPRGVLSAC